MPYPYSIGIATLHDKLSEEHREFLSAVSRLDKCEALADLIEVIIALAEQHRCDEAAPMEIVARKRAERGSFAMGFLWEGDLSPALWVNTVCIAGLE
jgi:predicted house-cleaning noncanonical NTP pyrophosphatase (MazG superfamily)